MLRSVVKQMSNSANVCSVLQEDGNELRKPESPFIGAQVPTKQSSSFPFALRCSADGSTSSSLSDNICLRQSEEEPAPLGFSPSWLGVGVWICEAEDLYCEDVHPWADWGIWATGNWQETKHRVLHMLLLKIPDYLLCFFIWFGFFFCSWHHNF